ncbi:MAG TPA: penicillin-binding protein, partial [Thermotoga sp.]|nr:penicillin-binding protein [Thermotoga sp.]
LGLKLGVEKMRKIASLLKLDDRTGIDLPGEVKGIFPSPSWKLEKYGESWYPGDTILLSIGQGYILLTPMEMLNFISFIANRGKVFKPHVVKKVGEKLIKPTIFLNVNIRKDIWDYLIKSLEDVTSFSDTDNEDIGTAYIAFKDCSYPVAGKTGTAEIGQDKPHSWFIGFSPIKDPEVAIVVLIEKGGYGSEIAAPIARQILDMYFKLKSR